MKALQVMLSVAISFLALMQYNCNGNLAASSSILPKAESHGARGSSKIMRVTRRDTDICERLIASYNKKTRTHCIAIANNTPICSKTECPFKPSPPSDIKIDFYLNTTTKGLNLKVTWKEPKFGLNNVCGYRLECGSLTSHIATNCIQLNSKNVHSYSIPNVRFNEEYKISVVSLPAFENIEESKISVKKKSPDECTVLRKANESLPLQCKMRSNFPVVCKGGFINVTLDKIYNDDMDVYYSQVICRGSQKPYTSLRQHVKNQQFAVYYNLTLDVEYLLLVSARKKSRYYRVRSKPFTCQGEEKHSTLHQIDSTTRTTDSSTTKIFMSTPKNDGKDAILITWLIISSCIILVLFIVISIKLKLMYKLRALVRNRHPRDTSCSLETIILPGQSREYQHKALVVYPFGCTYLEEFVALLGQLLKMMDFRCVVDLYMERDREVFMMKKLNKLQKDDYVIFINYKDTDACSQYALKRHEDMICKRILQRLLSDDNFISIHFDKQGTTNLASNICFAVDARNELERFIRLMWGIPKFQLGKECPHKNTIEVHPDLECRILSKINDLMATFHQECLITSCSKGKDAVEYIQAQATSLNGKVASKNSFDSLPFDSDYVVSDKSNREKLSRLSSSEPLLK